jgi:hypothetical protein
MNYLHTYPNAVIGYHASDMILKITSDAAYLVQPKARSRAAVHYHLGWLNSDRVNGAVDVLFKLSKTLFLPLRKPELAESTSEANTPAPCEPCYKNSVIASQRPDRLSTPATTLPKAFENAKMRQKLSKSFDMRYWWMKDCIHQRQFDLNWSPGKFNLADYFTKHHLLWHHRKMRYKYLQKVNSMQRLQNTVSARGCVSSTNPPPVPRNTGRTDQRRAVAFRKQRQLQFAP